MQVGASFYYVMMLLDFVQLYYIVLPLFRMQALNNNGLAQT